MSKERFLNPFDTPNNDIENELSRLLELKAEDNWSSSTRNKEYYDVVNRIFPFGERKVYVPKIKNKYVDLQSSRAIGIELRDDIVKLIERAKNDLMTLKESDFVRIGELYEYDISPKKGFAEIGFRVPKLLRYYQERFNVPCVGFDIVPINLLVGKHFGYNVIEHDLSSQNNIDLTNNDLVVCYHVLEHMDNPHEAIQKIYNSMDLGTFFHVEVPIEPGVPQLNFGHLFPFENGDLSFLLENVGFKVLFQTNATHSDGPLVERCLVQKN